MSHAGEPGPEGLPGDSAGSEYVMHSPFGEFGPTGPDDPGIKLGQFLELMNADLQNEWTHLQFYLYHASSITGLHAEEYKEFFTDAAKGELEHVQQFLDRLHGLNFNLPNWCGHKFPIFTKVEDALSHAIRIEDEVVTNYAKRLKQLEMLVGSHPAIAAYLSIFYENQLQDSYEDCEKLRRIMANDLSVKYRNIDRVTPA